MVQGGGDQPGLRQSLARARGMAEGFPAIAALLARWEQELAPAWEEPAGQWAVLVRLARAVGY